MTDRYKVYTKVLKTLKQFVKLDHSGHVVTLAMMIAGIVMSKKAQLSEMSNEVPATAKDKSIEMRMRRWVKQDGCIDRTDRQDKSLFRLGLDWIRHCLKRNLEFEPLFWFQLQPEIVNVR
jgi:hypothetical protein